MSSRNVLIVDDSDSMRQIIAFALASAGYKVREAINGVEALELAIEERFDAILTDINMPEMDGYTLIEKLRASNGYRGIPIITLTTEHSDESKQRAREAGATGWIIKPFNAEKLVSTLKQLVA